MASKNIITDQTNYIIVLLAVAVYVCDHFFYFWKIFTAIENIIEYKVGF